MENLTAPMGGKPACKGITIPFHIFFFGSEKPKKQKNNKTKKKKKKTKTHTHTQKKPEISWANVPRKPPLKLRVSHCSVHGRHCINTG